MTPYFSSALLLAAAALASGEEAVGPPGIALDYVTTLPPEIGALHLNILVTPHQTSIRDGNRVITIDYEALEVRRDEGPDAELDPLVQPVVYRLVDPHAPADEEHDDEDEGARAIRLAREEMERAISTYEITSESAGAPVLGFPVSQRTVWFGRGFLEARDEGELYYPIWGRRFTERAVRFWVTVDHEDFPLLADIAAQREPVLRANPMLAHVDWTLLVPELGGLPVALEERGKDFLMRIELQLPEP